jgi:SAM-dependent methyltransferase
MSLKHLVPKKLRGPVNRCRLKAFAVVKKTGHALGLGKLIWQNALPSEVGFWEDYLKSHGKSCSAEAEFQFRTDAQAAMQPWLCELLKFPVGSKVRVLDVGAGPLTWVGKKWAGHEVEIIAIDPLADAYNQIMQQHNITPPVRTQKGDGEEVVKMFGRDQFDLAFARNCLDHAYDAMLAVTSMIEATKPGGIIFLWHNEDEAEQLHYDGLHQWNFRLQNNELLVWKGGRVLNVNQSFGARLQVIRCERIDGMIQAVYRKVK